MSGKNGFGRRAFIGTGVVGAGGLVGWLMRKLQDAGIKTGKSGVALDRKFSKYDLSKFEQTDPAHLIYEPGGSFETGFEQVKRIEAGPEGKVLVAGDKAVRIFSKSGERIGEIPLERVPHCLHLAENGELFIGLANYFEVYDLEGNRSYRSEKFPGQAFLTAIVSSGEKLYLADAGNREVLVCDRASGALLERFGKKDETRGNPGFAVPSPYFDLAVASDGSLRVANPGRLRVESYSSGGDFESSWGEPGMKIDRFCGCCNPVYFAMKPDGGFVTSEKGLARINTYDAQGAFVGAVAGPDGLVEDKALAKRACTDCTVGAGFDVALDEGGAVLVLDPFKKMVRRYEPVKTPA